MNIKLLIIAFPLLLTAACGGGGGSSDSTDAADSAQNSLRVTLTDAPVDDAANVFVTLRGIALNHDDSGWVDYDFDEPEKIDLLTLQSGNTLTLFDEDDVEPGSYGVRLNLYSDDDNQLDHYIVIEEGGEQFELRIPSGEQTGLKLNSSIEVLQTGAADYTIDFDVRRSVVLRGNANNNNGYQLKPVLRLVNNSASGSITGTIDDTSLLTTDCSDDDPLTHNVIYVFEGTGVTPDDIDEDGVEPITTANVVFDEDSGVYRYTAAFLPVGGYTISLTCNADLEDLELDDELLFKATANVTVEAEDEDQDDDQDDE